MTAGSNVEAHAQVAPKTHLRANHNNLRQGRNGFALYNPPLNHHQRTLKVPYKGPCVSPPMIFGLFGRVPCAQRCKLKDLKFQRLMLMKVQSPYFYSDNS